LRIAFDTRWIRTSNLEGIGGYSLELLEELLAADKSNQYLLFFESDDRVRYFRKRFKPERFNNVEVVKTGLTLSSLWVNVVFLPRFLRKHKVDIYHVPYFAFTPFKSNYKTVATVYDLVPFLYPRYSVRDCPVLRYIFRNRTFAKFIMSKADGFVACSSRSLEYMKDKCGIKEDKLKLIYPGVGRDFRPITDKDKLESVASKYDLPRDYVLYMGELGLHKNITNLVKAFLMMNGRLRKKHKLVIIGRGEKLYPRDIDGVMKKGKLHEDIVMPGYILMEDKPAIYSMAKAFVSPTLYEGFPLFILEAMACGVPVAASGIPELAEFVGDSIFQIDPSKPESISIALERILTDENLRAALVNKGSDVSSKFSYKNTAGQILSVYEELSK
jgi:glycosyltransferase involved in cell wall biosynthesis